MQPIGLLIKEHRLIEQMIHVLEKHLKTSSEDQTVDVEFVMKVIDFFRNFADKIHHGKEEHILFRELEKKQLKPETKKTLKQLQEDHKLAREIITLLNSDIIQYKQGDQHVLYHIQERLHQLIALYPHHIELEDKHFFFPIMDYFTRYERDAMLQKFDDFDKTMIHDYYFSLVEALEKS